MRRLSPVLAVLMVVAAACSPAGEAVTLPPPPKLTVLPADEDQAPTDPLTTTTAPPATTTSVPGSRSYVVRSGDTLYGIATAFGTTVDQLVELNDIDDPTLIGPGLELVVPPAPTTGAQASPGVDPDQEGTGALAEEERPPSTAPVGTGSPRNERPSR